VSEPWYSLIVDGINAPGMHWRGNRIKH